jgi:hypothetical protein
LKGGFGVHAQGEAPSKDARQEGASALVELEEAYNVLHNARTREKYDRLGYDGASLSPLVGRTLAVSVRAFSASSCVALSPAALWAAASVVAVRTFNMACDTLQSWMRRRRDGGNAALVQVDCKS